ncbi:flavin reductase family protein [Sciscionella marina]|uniref:flavin reductase family protein n=1 Tax=Sciscionella marina TaxID=508770 RepID=UPI00036E96E0|nr:flavin reductase family protein [Sciscionella marina]
MTTDQDLEPSVDPGRLRTTMSRFCTGVAVITGVDEAGPTGLLVQSLVSVSLDPPLVLFCPQKTSRSWPRIVETGRFGANILSGAQQQLCDTFAVSGGDKFRGVRWHPSRTGTPVLEGHLAYVECRLETVHDAGDHEIVLGRVTDLDESELDDPLLFYRGRFGSWAA